MRAHPAKRRGAPRLILTERDREILRLLDRHLLLTRLHLQQLLGWSCVTRINRRLRQLFDAGFIERRFMPVHSGSAPAIYFLGREATRILADAETIDADVLLRRRRRHQRLPDSTLSHDLFTSDFIASFSYHCTNCPEGEWLTWLSEYDFLSACLNVKAPFTLMPRPDGYGRYAINHALYQFCLELDTGSESIRRIRRKLEIYQEALTSGHFQRLFKLTRLTVLIVTTTPGRAASLARRLTRIESLRVLIGTLEQVVTDPLFGSVWRVPRETGLFSLHKMNPASGAN